MAGDNYWYWVGAVGLSDGSGSARIAYVSREVAVTEHDTVRDFGESLPNSSLECSAAKFKSQIKLRSCTCKIFLELISDVITALC